MTITTDTSNHFNRSAVAQIETPRIEHGKALLIAGIRNRYVDRTMDTIASQWLRFAVHIDRVPGQVGHETYGLSFLGKGSPGIEYLTGVAVSGSDRLPEGFSCVSIPAQRYAVFVHPGHVSTVRETCEAIGTRWLPESGFQIAPKVSGTPDFFERYTREFNPQTGLGGIEIWIPIK